MEREGVPLGALAVLEEGGGGGGGLMAPVEAGLDAGEGEEGGPALMEEGGSCLEVVCGLGLGLEMGEEGPGGAWIGACPPPPPPPPPPHTRAWIGSLALRREE